MTSGYPDHDKRRRSKGNGGWWTVPGFGECMGFGLLFVEVADGAGLLEMGDGCFAGLG